MKGQKFKILICLAALLSLNAGLGAQTNIIYDQSDVARLQFIRHVRAWTFPWTTLRRSWPSASEGRPLVCV